MLVRRLLATACVPVLLGFFATVRAEPLSIDALSITATPFAGVQLNLKVSEDGTYAVHASSNFFEWMELGVARSSNQFLQFRDKRVAVDRLDRNIGPVRLARRGASSPDFRLSPYQRHYRLLELKEPEVIRGQVMDLKGDPIAGAKITQFGSADEVVSDVAGQFTLAGRSPSDPQLSRVFVAEAEGFVSSVLQPSYERTASYLAFALKPQRDATVAPQSLVERSFLYGDKWLSTISTLTIPYQRLSDGTYYFSARDGDSFQITTLGALGAFLRLDMSFLIPGCGFLSEMEFAGVPVIYASDCFIDVSGASPPPAVLAAGGWRFEALHNMGGSTFLFGLVCNTEVSGTFRSTVDGQPEHDGQFHYFPGEQNATLTLKTEALESYFNDAEIILSFQTPETGRFIFFDKPFRNAYCGAFQREPANPNP